MLGMTPRKSRWIGVAAVLAGMAAAAIALWMASRGDDSLERVRNVGVLRVGYAVEAPYALVAADGRITGESPELARLVAARLNLPRIEWVQTRFDALIVELLEGRFDVVAAGMFVTPERARQVRFSRPSLRVGASLLVPTGNPEGLTSYEDAVSRPGLRIAALAGSVEEGGLLARGLPRNRLLAVPDAAAGSAAVRAGAAAALALSRPTTRWLARQAPDRVESVAVAGRAESAGATPSFLVAFAFAPDDRNLANAWDDALAKVLGSPDHLRAIAAFGLGADDLPPPAGGAR
jgi:polar amino acid transport system substrate-binding protein